MFKDKKDKLSALDKLILEERTVKSLSPQELLDLYKCSEVTSLIFSLVQDEVCRRLKGA